METSIHMILGMTMNTNQSLLQLMTWLSPVFPTGGFSYSHGLESAIDDCLIKTREDLLNWIATLIQNGSQWNDCVLLVESSKQMQVGDISSVGELTKALAGSKERHLETMAQGAAFAKASAHWHGEHILPEELALPVAIGAVCSINAIEIETALTAYLHAFSSNQIQAALRLMTLGQQKGVWLQKEIEETILSVASKAASSSLEDLGSASVLAEISALRHETMQSRIFIT